MPEDDDHECHLLQQNQDVVNSFINTGMFIALRRKCRSAFMLNRRHPQSAVYVKSITSCCNEQIRHLLHYYYMIHPFSLFNLYWEFYFFTLLSVQFVLIPIDAIYPVHNVGYLVYRLRFITDVLQLFDMVKIFFTGYYNKQRSIVVLNFSHVAKRYLLSFFIFDILSCTYSATYFMSKTEVQKCVEGLVHVRLLNRFKICRMPRYLDTLELIRQYMGYTSYLFKGIRVVLIFLIMTFWAVSIMFYIDNNLKLFTKSPQPRSNEISAIDVCKRYHSATLLLLLVSVGKEDLKYIVHFVVSTVFLCFGFALQMFLFAQILQVWNKYVSAGNKQHSLHEQFKEYMKYKELPIVLRERIFCYFEFKFHKQFFKESEIYNMISPTLRQEILLHVTKSHVEKVDFFRYLPESILTKVVSELKSEIYLPGDVIISAGSSGNCMFFIYHGTVAVYTPTGKEICHLEDGAHFGEIALIFNETRVATVIAVSPCELFLLKRSDFLEVIEPFPELKEELITLARERLNKTIGQSE